jgi:ABC-type branched-subunit amino acid transport system substrate-binding protein
VRFKFATGTVALGTAAALAFATAIPAQAADPGVTSNKIVIGMTTPLTGPAAPGYKDIPTAAKAYFDYVNRNGGINGRKVDLRVFDDAYNPALTKKGTSQLILRDKIFAMFGALGTPTHSAVVQDLNRRGIPDVFINTGGASFDNPGRYPMTFPYLPSYIVESKVMGYYMQNDSALKAKKKCLFYQDGEFGDNATVGFNAAGISFDTTTSYFSGQQVSPFTAQISKLKSAGCELVVFFGVTSATANLLGTAAKSGFAPTWMITSVGSDPSVLKGFLGAATGPLLKGAYVPSFLVPDQEIKNPFVSQMRAIAKAAGLDWNYYTYNGINTAYVLAQAIKGAGKNLTRKGLVNALQTQSKTFRSAAVVPMVINSKSHQGLTGYFMGQYAANLDLERLTQYVMVATSSSKGTTQKITFSPAPPTKKLLP